MSVISLLLVRGVGSMSGWLFLLACGVVCVCLSVSDWLLTCGLVCLSVSGPLTSRILLLARSRVRSVLPRADSEDLSMALTLLLMMFKCRTPRPRNT